MVSSSQILTLSRTAIICKSCK